MKKNTVILLLCVIGLQSCVLAQNNDNLLKPSSNVEIQNTQKNPQSYFNLANIVDGFLSESNKQGTEEMDEIIPKRKKFLSTTKKFNQGNVSPAYDEYSALIDEIENDNALLAISKVFYELGFFTLGDKAIDKIVLKNQFEDAVKDLKRTYKPKTALSKEDEIYFAKLYSSIYFDNSSFEAAGELTKNKNKFSKNDFAQYTLAKAQYEQKRYKDALSAINKAISQNPENISYQMYKIDILCAQKKYSDAKNLIKKLKKNSLIVLSNDLRIKEYTILAQASDDEKLKKYYALNIAYEQGNYEKVKKECQNILNFDKDNDNILSLYAKSELALGNIERANSYFVTSHKIKKNNLNTIIGLGDIKYLHGDYKGSVKTYKKAQRKDSGNYEITLKLALAQQQYAKNPKQIKKLKDKLDKMPIGDYLVYYDSAISIGQKNAVLKEELLKRSIRVNPLFENSIGELIELNLKNKNFINAKNLIHIASYTLEKNYYYYYLCGLYNQATNQKKDAIRFYKTSIELNPSFEIANTKLLNLIPNSFGEEI